VLVSELNARIDRRMNDHPAGERLVSVQRQLVRLSEFVGNRGRIVAGAEDIQPPVLAFEGEVGAGEVARRQQRSGQAVLCGASGMKALGHRSEHLAQPDRLRGRQSQRPHHLLRCQPEDPAGRRGSAEHADGARDVPPPIVVRWIHGRADPALRFNAEDHRIHEVVAGHRPLLGQGKQHRDDRTGRMDNRVEMRVVEIEHVRAHRVHQARMQRVQPLAPADDRRSRRP
jgi:hypothetical protein